MKRVDVFERQTEDPMFFAYKNHMLFLSCWSDLKAHLEDQEDGIGLRAQAEDKLQRVYVLHSRNTEVTGKEHYLGPKEIYYFADYTIDEEGEITWQAACFVEMIRVNDLDISKEREYRIFAQEEELVELINDMLFGDT